MEEFIGQCLADLEPLTGIRQMFFLQQDPDGKRKTTVLIKGIVLACQQYTYIPEEDQKKIISKMMIEDQHYDAINSRTVHKWLSLNKDFYWSKAHPSQIEVPAKLEPLSEDTLKIIRKFQVECLGMSLSTAFGIPTAEMEKIKQEDTARAEGELKPKAIKHPGTSLEEAKSRDLHDQWIRKCYDLYTGKPNENWVPENEFIKQLTEIQ